MADCNWDITVFRQDKRFFFEIKSVCVLLFTVPIPVADTIEKQIPIGKHILASHYWTMQNKLKVSEWQQHNCNNNQKEEKIGDPRSTKVAATCKSGDEKKNRSSFRDIISLKKRI